MATVAFCLPVNSPSCSCAQTESTLSAHQYAPMGASQAFSLAKFKKGLNITITKYEGDDMEFEMKGISCAVSHAGVMEVGPYKVATSSTHKFPCCHLCK